MERFKCSCGGTVNTAQPITISANLIGMDIVAYFCSRCRKLHKEKDVPLLDESENRCFYESWSCIVKDEQDQILGVFNACST